MNNWSRPHGQEPDEFEMRTIELIAAFSIVVEIAALHVVVLCALAGNVIMVVVGLALVTFWANMILYSWRDARGLL